MTPVINVIGLMIDLAIKGDCRDAEYETNDQSDRQRKRFGLGGGHQVAHNGSRVRGDDRKNLADMTATCIRSSTI